MASPLQPPSLRGRKWVRRVAKQGRLPAVQRDFNTGRSGKSPTWHEITIPLDAHDVEDSPTRRTAQSRERAEHACNGRQNRDRTWPGPTFPSASHHLWRTTIETSFYMAFHFLS